MKKFLTLTLVTLAAVFAYGTSIAFDSGTYSSPTRGVVTESTWKQMNKLCEEAMDQSIIVDKQQCQWYQNYTRFSGKLAIYDGTTRPLCHWKVRCKPGTFGIKSGAEKEGGISDPDYLMKIARCNERPYTKIASGCEPVTKDTIENTMHEVYMVAWRARDRHPASEAPWANPDLKPHYERWNHFMNLVQHHKKDSEAKQYAEIHAAKGWAPWIEIVDLMQGF